MQGRRFVEQVAGICRANRITHVFPCHEDALVLREHARLLANGVQLVCPSAEVIRRCIDKAEMTQLAESAGVAIPRSLFPASAEALLEGVSAWELPVVLKLRRGNSGKGVYIESSRAGVAQRVEQTLKPYFEAGERLPYAQQFVDGQVLGACFFAVEGKMHAFFGERYLRTKNAGIGTSTWRVPCDLSQLRESTGKMVEALGWNGLGHMDFMLDRSDDVVRFLEINPRPWGGIHHAIANGYDFPAAQMAMAEGSDPTAGGYFDAAGSRRSRPSLWLLGEMIRTVHLIKERRWREGLLSPLLTLRALFGGRLDDFHWTDPAPFFAQAWCYGRQFLRSGGNTNPDAAGMTD